MDSSVSPIVVWNLAALWFVVIVLFLLIVGLARRQNGTAEVAGRSMATLMPGDEAPPFSAELLNGGAVTFESFAGSDIAFLFMAPTCQPCLKRLAEVPQALRVADELGIRLVLISTGDADSTRSMMSAYPSEIEVIVAPRDNNPFMKDYKVVGTPSYVVVSKKGLVLESAIASRELDLTVSSWHRLLRPDARVELSALRADAEVSREGVVGD